MYRFGESKCPADGSAEQGSENIEDALNSEPLGLTNCRQGSLATQDGNLALPSSMIRRLVLNLENAFTTTKRCMMTPLIPSIYILHIIYI